MSKKAKIISGLALTFIVLLLAGAYIAAHNIEVLNPKGLIATEQRKLIIEALLLMLIVVVPVFILTFSIAWRYRESNKSAKYSPSWDSSLPLELLWWGIPMAIIMILSVITWHSSHTLDPFKPIESDKKPLNIQVIALRWKWLFIYPEQKVATVNIVQFPVNQPVNFEITSDAPMNSFWIPQLGGQIYAMSGMSTHLNLIANEAGSYSGSSANLSGQGFAGMRFIARASSEADFKSWVSSVRQSSNRLSLQKYTSSLAQPSEDNPQLYFSSLDPRLFNQVIAKYSYPSRQSDNTYDSQQGSSLWTY